MVDGEDVFLFWKSFKFFMIESNVDEKFGEGCLNVLVWEEICGYELMLLKEFLFFLYLLILC